jgi:formylglycine-generating enzyme required for sulfatase activity
MNESTFFNTRMLRFLALGILCFFVMLPGYSTANSTTPTRITMVDIPAGHFVMGACKIQPDHAAENKKRAFMGSEPLPAHCPIQDNHATDYEMPQRKVAIQKFQLSKTEITLGQFKKFIQAEKRTDLLNEDFIKYNNNGDTAAVVMVNWQDAQDFIRWLNQTGRRGYRLPTEAEWEYACRAGRPTLYCGADQVDEVGWYLHNAEQRTQSVGRKKANAFGLHDMSGNVLEWVQDCWNPNYHNAPTDGSAWTECIDGYHVQRGGSWIDEPQYLRATARQVDTPGSRGNDIGFRVARTLR